jgi:hypothetical protein
LSGNDIRPSGLHICNHSDLSLSWQQFEQFVEFQRIFQLERLIEFQRLQFVVIE